MVSKLRKKMFNAILSDGLLLYRFYIKNWNKGYNINAWALIGKLTLNNSSHFIEKLSINPMIYFLVVPQGYWEIEQKLWKILLI